VRMDDRVQKGAMDGDVVIDNVIFSCQELTHTSDFWLDDNGNPTTTNTESFLLTDSGNQNASVASGTAKNPTATADVDLQLLEGVQPIFSIDWATSLVDNAAPLATTDPDPDTYLGALSMADTNWTAGWTYGIDPNNRGEDLWFE
jgi:hypothetical protein